MPSPFERPEIGQAILDASGDGAALISGDLHVTWANERAHELLRARPGSLVGRHLFSFIPDEDLVNPDTDWRAFHQHRAERVTMQPRNDLVLTRDDTTRDTFVVGGTWVDEDTVLILFNQFEGRAEIEEKAVLLSQRYQDLFQNIPVAVWEIDMRGLVPWLDALSCPPEETAAWLDSHPEEIVDHLELLDVRAVNRVGLRQLEAESAAGRDIDDAMMGGAQPGSLGGFPAQFQAVRTRTQSIVTEGVGGTGSGGRFNTEVHQYIPETEAGLDLSRVIVTLINTTVAKRTEAALEAAIDARDRLVSSVAHELRTPLTVVLGLLHLLLDDPGNLTEDERLDLVAQTTAEAEDLNHLVDDLLTYARIGTADWHIAPAAVDLRELVSAVEVRSEEGTKPMIPVEGEAQALADPRRVRQVIRNLLTNAVRYGGPNIRVRISSDDMARVEVRDDGPEFAADQERIFEAFQRAHSTPTQPSSLGLGLTISRGLAEAMGGSLTHRRDEGWTVFELRLPLP